MKKNYSFKYFEFAKNHFKSPEKLGHYDLYQVGEVEMSPNAYIDEHKQVCFEISYILSGEGTFYTQNTPIPVQAGDVHIISKDALHTIQTGKNKGIRFAFLGFSFNNKFPLDTLGSIPALFKTNPERIAHDNGELGRLFALLIDETYNGDNHSAVVCESLINCILILTERLFSGNKAKKFAPVPSEHFIGQPLYDIVRFIDRSVPVCPKVSEICQKFNYSESYISHLFKSKLGTGIKEYIISAKLNYSKLLLSEEKQTILETAQTLGYSSSQSFCKSFKKQFGCSPTEYKHKNNQQQKAD